MEGTRNTVCTISITASVDLEKNRFIGFDGSYCAAGKALGISQTEASSGEAVPVDLFGKLLIEASAAIAVGDAVAAAADGKAAKAAEGDVINGYAMSTAAAAGDIIEIARGI